MLRYLRLQLAIVSYSLRQLLTFRANFFLLIFFSLMDSASGIAILGTVYTQTHALNGWSEAQSFVLFGTFMIVGGLNAAFFSQNSSWFASKLRDGQFDATLVQPISSLYMTSCGQSNLPLLINAFVGLITVIVGAAHLGVQITIWGVLGWLVLIGVGLVVAWGTHLLIVGLAFWAPALELDVFYSSIWNFARYPISIYRDPLRFLLTYVLPFVFLATLPAGVLAGNVSFWLVPLGVGVAFLFILVTCAFWRLAIRRYTSATS